MRAIILGLGVILAAVTATPVAKAQSSDVPQVENARVEKKSLAEPLAAEMKAWATKAEQPQWLGYAVPQIGRERTMCCGDYDGSWRNGCGHCRLEDRGDGTNMTTKEDTGTAKLEAPRFIAVLFRAENKHVTKIRVMSLECSLDAGGLHFVWLSGVKPAESVELLETFVQGSDLDAHDDNRTSPPLHCTPTRQPIARWNRLRATASPNLCESKRRSGWARQGKRPGSRC